MSLLKLLPPSTRNELSCLGIRKDLSPKSLTRAGTLLTLGSPKYREAASIVDLATGHVKNAHVRKWMVKKAGPRLRDPAF